MMRGARQGTRVRSAQRAGARWQLCAYAAAHSAALFTRCRRCATAQVFTSEPPRAAMPLVDEPRHRLRQYAYRAATFMAIDADTRHLSSSLMSRLRATLP